MTASLALHDVVSFSAVLTCIWLVHAWFALLAQSTVATPSPSFDSDPRMQHAYNTVFTSFRNIVAFKGSGKQEDSDYLMQEYIVGGMRRLKLVSTLPLHDLCDVM